MTRDKTLLCLSHLDAAETLLLDARDWLNAAHIAMMIDRLRIGHGLPERPARFADSASPALVGSKRD